jgi:hypothetical protein
MPKCTEDRIEFGGIKEAQLDLFGTRASCYKFLADQFRLLLAALAYPLMDRLRSLALQGTALANAYAVVIRSKPHEHAFTRPQPRVSARSRKTALTRVGLGPVNRVLESIVAPEYLRAPHESG